MSGILSISQRLQTGAQPNSAPIPIPAPVKGWNSRDEFDAMDPLDAVQLDNWYPDAGGVYVRNGWEFFATVVTGPITDDVGHPITDDTGGFITGDDGDSGGPVKTLAEYDAGGIQKFLAAAMGKIYDISSGGSPTALLGSGYNSDEWQTTPFLSRLFFCNGVDNVQVFDGTTLTDAAFTGVDTSTLVGVYQYQQSLYFWQKNSTGFWFAPLNSISGALQFYDLAAFAPNGGNLVAMTTVTHDGGNGVLDFAAFIMSSGDMLLYFGNDPSQVSAWQEIGRYRLSPPVSPRAVCSYGGDSFITTFDDHVMLQQQLVALKIGTLAPRSKVSKAVQLAVQADGNAFGWQALYYPRGRRLMFNIPNPDGTFDQHVCNTGLPDQPWCRFTGMNAQCWGLFKNLLYFGDSDGNINLADTGSLDDMGAIQAVAQQAWNKMDTPTRKRVTASRPVLQSFGGIAYTFSLGFDYGPLNIDVPVSIPAQGSPWDTSPWDTSPWSNEFTVSPLWRAAGGSGTAVGFGIGMAATDTVAWFRTDLRLEQGNAL